MGLRRAIECLDQVRHDRLVGGIVRSGLADRRHLARTLVHQNLVDETQDGYPVVVLNARSWEVLRGARQVSLVESVRPARKQKRAATSAMDDADTSLFDALRKVRKKLADEQGLPPYVIFHDATLREIARLRPTSITALEHIYGMGAKKAQTLGPSVLEVLSGQRAEGNGHRTG